MSLGKKLIFSSSLNSAGNQNIVIPLTVLPYYGDNGHAYLRKLRFHIDGAVVTTGGSGCTSKMLHDILGSVSIKVQGRFFGLKALSGSQMTAIMASFGQKPKRVVSNLGDIPIGISTTGAREVVIDWDFGLLGDQPNDFARPCAWFGRSGAELQVNTSAVVAANISAYTTVTLNIWAEYDSKPEKTFTPWVLFESRGVDTLSNGTLGRGRLLKLLAQNSGDWVKADCTNLTLYVNGTPLLDGEIPYVNLVDTPARSRETTAAAAGFGAQENFLTNMGGTANTLSFMPVYPSNADDRRITKRPYGDYTFNFTGGETAANITWVYGFVETFNIGEAKQAFAYMGEPLENLASQLGTPEAAVANLSVKTATKSPTSNALLGILPAKLA
jgi:hypothetical protein